MSELHTRHVVREHLSRSLNAIMTAQVEWIPDNEYLNILVSVESDLDVSSSGMTQQRPIFP